MMQLVCNGVALDIKSGAALSFKKTNPLFAFDELSCERSQSFDIPATPKNEAVFQLAKIAAFRGDGMRRKFDCELQDGTTVKRGTLYVDKYSNGDYSGVFVTGELIGLQALKNAGKIAEIIHPTNTVIWSPDTASKPANSQSLLPWDLVWYEDEKRTQYTPGLQLNPSYSLAWIIQQAAAALGVHITLPEETAGARVIVGELKSADEMVGFSFSVIDPSQPQRQQPASPYNDTYASGAPELFGKDTESFITYRIVSDARYETYYYRATQFRALSDLQITFPADFPANVFMVSFNGAAYTFLGDYSFTKTETGRVIVTGEPLAGRAVDLAIGGTFVFLTPDDFVNEVEESEEEGQIVTYGWRMTSWPKRYTANVTTSVVLGSVVRLFDNLPELTVTELLKIIAALSGRVLNYTDAEGVTFDELNIAEWPTIDVTGMVLTQDSLTRTFGDYAQRNIVNFESDESVLTIDKVSRVYILQNDNIEQERTLQTIPFSEGGKKGVNVYIRNKNVDEFGDTIGIAGISSDLMQAVLPSIGGLQSLLNASTSVSIKLRMTLAQYDSVRAKTAVLYAGTRYVWTDATWGNDVATFNLAKI